MPVRNMAAFVYMKDSSLEDKRSIYQRKRNSMTNKNAILFGKELYKDF